MAKATATNPVTSAVRTGCATLKRLVKTLEDRIKSENRRLLQLVSTLRQLESQPNPDKARIKAVKAEIAALEKQSEKDAADLSELQDVVRENCH